MSDYLRCDFPLPDGWNPARRVFRARDLGDGLDGLTHVITADGHLMRERVTGDEEVPLSERPFPDAPEGSFKWMAGSYRTITVLERDTEIDGFVFFDGSETYEDPEGNTVKSEIGWSSGPGMEAQSVDGKRYSWRYHDYAAKFFRGELACIVMASRVRQEVAFVALAEERRPGMIGSVFRTPSRETVRVTDVLEDGSGVADVAVCERPDGTRVTFPAGWLEENCEQIASPPPADGGHLEPWAVTSAK